MTALLLSLWFLAACALARPAASGGPEPVPSASLPAVAGKGDPSFARRGLESIRTRLAAREEGERSGGFSLAEKELAARCLRADGADEVVLCQFGPAPDRWVAQGLFWQEDGLWEGQLYPQAPDYLALERQEHFRALGCACQGKVRQARLEDGESGPELLVVIDLGKAELPMEEVHLLRLKGGIWRVAWVPAPGDWNWGHARVTLSQPGLTGFGVRSSSWGRQDRFAGYLAAGGEHRWFTERWVRKGAGYVLRDQAEEPGAYGSLVRLIYYLSHHDEERARALIGPAVALEEAQKALAQRPPRQGWGVAKTGPGAFGIDRDGDGEPDLHATFAEHDGTWVLVGLDGPG